MRPFSLKKIDHLVLRVTDLEKSLQFYTQILGCEIARRRPDLGLVHLRVGVSMLDLVDVDGVLGKKGGQHPDARQQNVDHFCLRIEPFNEGELLAYLRSQGISVDPPRIPIWRRGRRAVSLFHRSRRQSRGAERPCGVASQGYSAELNDWLPSPA
ncbi:VOC family protein [Serratia liquefaciens]|uniref:VOC family protein n=1 Tax=Serratia liquefaciens TaxID=614 RepID=UPI0021B080D3|nr:VOC family protein [Serratia liquefaciens]